MKAVVTGGSGFIGSALVGQLRLDGWTVEVVDLAAGQDFRTTPIRADVVFHLAAHHYIPWCDLHPEETFATNAFGFAQMLAGLGDVKAVVFASSAAVYGFSGSRRLETDTPNARDVYGCSKWTAEQFFRRWSADHLDVACVAARLFNVVGPGDPWPHILPRLVEAVRTGEEITVGNLTPRRDYVHVADAAAALKGMADNPPGFDVFNVCTSRGTSVAELIAAVGSYGTLRWRSERGRASDGHLVGSYDLLRHVNGWVPLRTLDDAIREML
jgi:UDP-glucose 4-epimerase